MMFQMPADCRAVGSFLMSWMGSGLCPLPRRGCRAVPSMGAVPMGCPVCASLALQPVLIPQKSAPSFWLHTAAVKMHFFFFFLKGKKDCYQLFVIIPEMYFALATLANATAFYLVFQVLCFCPCSVGTLTALAQ